VPRLSGNMAMYSTLPVQPADAGRRYGQFVLIAVAVMAGACLDAVWPQFLRNVVLLLKIAYYYAMSTG
jgi:hypothetical protein